YVLSDLRKSFGDYLDITRFTLSVHPECSYWLDTQYLESQLYDSRRTMQSMTQSLALCKGEFLAGFHVSNASNFAHWVSIEREKWAIRITYALRELVTMHIAKEQYAEALHVVEKILEVDPL